MKLYEYLGKELFGRYQIPVPRGRVVTTPEEAAATAAELGEAVVKAQVFYGKRGKEGGVAFAPNPSVAYREAVRILQARFQGSLVKKLLVEEKIAIEKELYLAVAVDGTTRMPLLLASLDGGMEVEEVSKERIVRWPIDVTIGLTSYIGREICRRLGATGELAQELQQLLPKVYRLFREYDAELVEINPLAWCSGRLIAVDAKVSIDDDALYRHQDLPVIHEKTSLEWRAHEMGLSFVELEGDIAVMANGAGITMATLDMIQNYGGSPANFLDCGGGAGIERTTEALELLLGTNPRVILINIFGGITRCDVVAKAFVKVKKSRKLDLPLSFRMAGTNEKAGRAILTKAGVQIFTSMEDAVRHAVTLAKLQPENGC